MKKTIIAILAFAIILTGCSEGSKPSPAPKPKASEFSEQVLEDIFEILKDSKSLSQDDAGHLIVLLHQAQDEGYLAKLEPKQAWDILSKISPFILQQDSPETLNGEVFTSLYDKLNQEQKSALNAVTSLYKDSESNDGSNVSEPTKGKGGGSTGLPSPAKQKETEKQTDGNSNSVDEEKKPEVSESVINETQEDLQFRFKSDDGDDVSDTSKDAGPLFTAEPESTEAQSKSTPEYKVTKSARSVGQRIFKNRRSAKQISALDTKAQSKGQGFFKKVRTFIAKKSSKKKRGQSTPK